MQLGDSLKNSAKQDIITKSIIWNTVIEIFKEEKKVDITKYLTSIKYMGNTILIKTNKPIINNELILLNEKIKKASVEKLQRLGLRPNLDLEIKYK